MKNAGGRLDLSREQAAKIVQNHNELIQLSVLSAVKGQISPELSKYFVSVESKRGSRIVGALKAVVDGARDINTLHLLDAGDAVIVSTVLNSIRNPSEFTKYLLSQSVQFMRHGYLPMAEAKAHDACMLMPENPLAHAQLGITLAAQHRLIEAEFAYRKSLSLDSESPLVHLNLGVTLQELKRFDEAMQAFDKAVRIQPDQIDAMAHLAYLYERAFLLDKARDLIRRGLQLKPDNATFRFIEGKLHQREGDIPGAISSFEESLNSNLSPALVSEAHSRLGYLFDRQNDVENAYRHFSEGNRIAERQNRQKGLNKDEYINEVDHIAGLVTDVARVDLGPLYSSEADGDRVFIVGFPRTGTTLLNQVLDSHPGIQTLEEKPAAYNMVRLFQKITAGRMRPWVDIRREEIGQLRSVYDETVDEFIDRRSDSVFVDKFPLNIAYVPIIWRVFPDAKFILALRHPCDACLSCFMHSFGANTAMANFTTLSDSIALYKKVMGQWEQFSAAFDLDVYRIRYEDLVVNFEEETTKLLEYLGCGWDDSVRNHTMNARQRGVIDTPSYDQITEPLYDRAMYRWLRYKDKFSPYLNELIPVIEKYGYQP